MRGVEVVAISVVDTAVGVFMTVYYTFLDVGHCIELLKKSGEESTEKLQEREQEVGLPRILDVR